MNAFQAILIIVGRGSADRVMQVAHENGAKGGTIVPCRGTGHHDSHELLYTALDSERELIVIVTPGDLTKQVAYAINEALALDEPGNGLLMTLELDEVKGLLM